MERFRKVICKLVGMVGLEGAYIYDALLNARNFQNTDEVVYTRPDAQRELFLERRPFERGITALEEAGFISKIPGSNPMRFVIHDDVYMSKLTSSNDGNMSKLTSSPESNMSKLTSSDVKTDMPTCQNEGGNMSELTSSTIKREENNRELVESKNINNNQPELDSLIFDFFINRGYSKAEAQKFIQYNKETKGKDHLNHDNYQTLGKMWIDNIRRKPKRAEVSSMRDPGRSDYKTAGEIARERGITVDEVLDELFPDIEKTKWDPEHQYDNDEDLIEVVFWEEFGEG